MTKEERDALIAHLVTIDPTEMCAIIEGGATYSKRPAADVQPSSDPQWVWVKDAALPSYDSKLVEAYKNELATLGHHAGQLLAQRDEARGSCQALYRVISGYADREQLVRNACGKVHEGQTALDLANDVLDTLDNGSGA